MAALFSFSFVGIGNYDSLGLGSMMVTLHLTNGHIEIFKLECHTCCQISNYRLSCAWIPVSYRTCHTFCQITKTGRLAGG